MLYTEVTITNSLSKLTELINSYFNQRFERGCFYANGKRPYGRTASDGYGRPSEKKRISSSATASTAAEKRYVPLGLRMLGLLHADYIGCRSDMRGYNRTFSLKSKNGRAHALPFLSFYQNVTVIVVPKPYSLSSFKSAL